MTFESLRPTSKPRVIDLVRDAGIDVTPWGFREDGSPVEVPAAANPAYCYEWAFSDGKIVVLSLWFDNLRLEDGKVFQRVNMRKLRTRIDRASHLSPGTKTTGSRRAYALDNHVQRAFRDKLVVRVIICEGDKRDLDNPEDRDPSRVELRALDSSPWHVTSYEYFGPAETAGNAVIIRDRALEAPA